MSERDKRVFDEDAQAQRIGLDRSSDFFLGLFVGTRSKQGSPGWNAVGNRRRHYFFLTYPACMSRSARPVTGSKSRT